MEKQIYTALSYEEEQNYNKFDIIPYGKAELGITQLSEYTDFGTTATNNVEIHESTYFLKQEMHLPALSLITLCIWMKAD